MNDYICSYNNNIVGLESSTATAILKKNGSFTLNFYSSRISRFLTIKNASQEWFSEMLSNTINHKCNGGLDQPWFKRITDAIELYYYEVGKWERWG